MVSDVTICPIAVSCAKGERCHFPTHSYLPNRLSQGKLLRAQTARSLQIFGVESIQAERHR
jgi:hypothetical protein